MAFAYPAMDRAVEEVKQHGWWYRTLPTDHSLVNLTMPKGIGLSCCLNWPDCSALAVALLGESTLEFVAQLSAKL